MHNFLKEEHIYKVVLKVTFSLALKTQYYLQNVMLIFEIEQLEDMQMKFVFATKTLQPHYKYLVLDLAVNSLGFS